MVLIIVWCCSSRIAIRLLGRLDALNEPLALSSISLLGELIALNHPLVLDKLVLAELAPFASSILAQCASGVSPGALDVVGL